MTCAIYLNARRVPFIPLRLVRAANDSPAILSPTSVAGSGAASGPFTGAAPKLVSAPFHGDDNAR